MISNIDKDPASQDFLRQRSRHIWRSFLTLKPFPTHVQNKQNLHTFLHFLPTKLLLVYSNLMRSLSPKKKKDSPKEYQKGRQNNLIGINFPKTNLSFKLTQSKNLNQTISIQRNPLLQVPTNSKPLQQLGNIIL